MKILIVEPFFTGSHKAWAQEYAQFSSHEIQIISLSGHNWKWRMHGGAITLSRIFLESNFQPDLILATDMLDLNVFLSLTRTKSYNIPTAIYFHENQLTYPWSETDSDVQNNRDNHYSFINYASALAADRIFFNSQYHKDSFFGELPKFLKLFPDNNELNSVDLLKEKSKVLYLGMDLKSLDKTQSIEADDIPGAVILWNHRWEYDKNPEGFFNALFELQTRGVDFKLVVLGQKYTRSPKIFEEAKERLANHILHFGFAEKFEDYANWLWQSDILPVTSNQDFFGASVVQAIYCNVIPLLPKRLAYPEHIPNQFHKTFFYDDNQDFVNRLQRLIFNVKVIRKQSVQHFVSCYDWNEIAPVYDQEFELLLK